MSDTRRDEAVQETARALLLGVALERQAELEALWSRYGPRFELLADSGSDAFFVLEAGLFKFVRFNHRAMRAFWLASFIAWEGYERLYAVANDEAPDFGRFNAMVDAFLAMLEADDPIAVPMPAGLPEPGIYPDGTLDREVRAAAELATLATGWALLHELRHIQHQQEGTGAPQVASRETIHNEELSCDAFATTLYAEAESVEAHQVHQKRQIGVYFALFAMALICAGRWAETETHPALQTRIDRVVDQMSPWCTEIANAIACAAFEALRLRWPSAPWPLKARDRWAARKKRCGMIP